MGCGYSKPMTIDEELKMRAEMEQLQSNKRRQMVLNDPEMKRLSEVYLGIRQKAIEAISLGDSTDAILVKRTFEHHMKNPKFRKLMYPDLSDMTRSVLILSLNDSVSQSDAYCPVFTSLLKLIEESGSSHGSLSVSDKKRVSAIPGGRVSQMENLVH